MRLFILRHGETDNNSSGLLQGHTQTPLNAVGEEQARRLAQRLSQEKIDHLYSSDLKRAKDTAKFIAQASGLSLNLTDKLRERSYGIYEGKPYEEFQKDAQNAGFQKHNFKPPQGESYIEVRNRAADFLTLLFNRYTEQNIAIVAHAAINKMLISCLLDTKFPDSVLVEQKNCCVNIIDICPDTVGSAVAINCTAHLD